MKRYLTRIVGWTIGLLLLIVLLLAGVVVALTTTQRGSQFVFDFTAQQLPEVAFESIAGTLYDGLSIGRTQLRMEGVSVLVTDLTLQINALELIDKGLLDIVLLHADSVIVHLDRNGVSASPAETDVLQSLQSLNLPQLPIDISLGSLKLKDLQIDEGNISNLQAAAQWQRENLNVTVHNIQVSQVSAQLEAKITQGATQLEYDQFMTWQAGELSGQLRLHGFGPQIELQHELKGLFPATLLSEGTFVPAPDNKINGRFEHWMESPVTRISTVLEYVNGGLNLDVDGTYAEHPVSGRLNFSPVEHGWEVKVQSINLADALTAEGHVSMRDGQITTGSARINIPELGSFHDAISGGLRIAGDIQSDLLHWRVESQLVEFSGFQGNQLVASGNVALDNSLDLSASVSFESVSAGEQRLAQPTLTINGTLPEFNFTLQSPTTHFAGQLNYIGTDNFNIQLPADNQLTWNEQKFANINAVEISYTNSGLYVSAHCWEGLGTWCIQTTDLSNPQQLEFTGSLDQVPLYQANILLPEPVGPVIGETSLLYGSWHLLVTPDSYDLSGTVNTKSVSLMFDHMDTPQATPDLAVAYRFTPRQWTLQANTQADSPNITLAVEGAPGSDWLANTRFSLTADQISPWLPDIDLRSGSVVGAASVRVPPDDLKSLKVQASGRVENANITTQAPETRWSDLNADWSISDQHWQFSVSSTLADVGMVNVTGEGHGLNSNGHASLAVHGSDLSIPTDFGPVSSNANITVEMQNQTVTATGSIDVLKADLKLNSLPVTTLKPSKDVVVDGRVQASPKAGTRVNGEITLNVHDAVSFSAAGVTAKLKGSLNAKLRNDELTGLSGALDIVNGSVEARGQVLRVETGRIIFSGDPNNPYIDVIAVRDIPNQSPPLQVGLHITGTLDDLRTSVYSNPILNETRALSFLVLGRDFDADSDSNPQLLTAALGFGLNRSRGVVEELRGRLGLDELSTLASQQNDVAIVAAKQITDKLYVKYRYNALSQLGALIVRYHLSEHWRIEATNDAASSIDLLFETTQ